MNVIPLWVKLLAVALVLAMGTAVVVTYNHAIETAVRLENEKKALSDRIGSLEAGAKEQTQRNQEFLSQITAHGDRIEVLDKKAAARQSYVGKTYAGATNEKRAVLDTDLPEFRCVFEGTCEAPVGNAAVPVPRK